MTKPHAISAAKEAIKRMNAGLYQNGGDYELELTTKESPFAFYVNLDCHYEHFSDEDSDSGRTFIESREVFIQPHSISVPDHIGDPHTFNLDDSEAEYFAQMLRDCCDLDYKHYELNL